MSFTGLPYDQGAYTHTLRETLGPAKWIFDTAPRNEYVCDPGDQEDVHSELLGITREASDCPGEQYIPSNQASSCAAAPPQLYNTPDFIRDEHSKLSNPPSTLRGQGVNRFDFLCEDPQNWALNPFHFPYSDTMLAKDNHRPLVARPVDPYAALPKPTRDLPPEKYTGPSVKRPPISMPIRRHEANFVTQDQGVVNGSTIM